MNKIVKCHLLMGHFVVNDRNDLELDNQATITILLYIASLQRNTCKEGEITENRVL